MIKFEVELFELRNGKFFRRVAERYSGQPMTCLPSREKGNLPQKPTMSDACTDRRPLPDHEVDPARSQCNNSALLRASFPQPLSRACAQLCGHRRSRFSGALPSFVAMLCGKHPTHPAGTTSTTRTTSTLLLLLLLLLLLRLPLPLLLLLLLLLLLMLMLMLMLMLILILIIITFSIIIILIIILIILLIIILLPLLLLRLRRPRHDCDYDDYDDDDCDYDDYDYVYDFDHDDDYFYS